jgi:hypothetical protein
MGDYSRKLDRYTDVSMSSVLAAADNLSVTARTLIAAETGTTIFVQKIAVNVIVDNAAVLQFKDTAGTPVVIAGTKASPGIGPILFDFGPDGRALTEAKALTLTNSAAGLAADITVTAYRRITGTQAA